VDEADQSRTITLEAFADTIIPGAKRYPGDRAIAGVSTGGGAVTAGAVELLRHPAGGLADSVDGLADLLNLHATEYASESNVDLDESVPPFVALSFADRTALILQLTAVDHPEKSLWVALALFSNMAFDSAPHLHTMQALSIGHPGLTTMGFAAADSDGVWRFPRYSYGRTLAKSHPLTLENGSLP